MKIKEEDFMIEKIQDQNFFNLSFNTTVKKKDGTEVSEYKIIAYGIPFDTCIKKIVDYRMRSKEGECTVKEYVKLYKQEVNKIGNLFE